MNCPGLQFLLGHNVDHFKISSAQCTMLIARSELHPLWKSARDHRVVLGLLGWGDDLKSHKLTLTEAVNMAQNPACYESTWLRTSHSGGCWLWLNMAQNQPLWNLLAISQHGSEPANLDPACYESTWLRTSHSAGCWLWVKMAHNQPLWTLLAMSGTMFCCAANQKWRRVHGVQGVTL